MDIETEVGTETETEITQDTQDILDIRSILIQDIQDIRIIHTILIIRTFHIILIIRDMAIQDIKEDTVIEKFFRESDFQLREGKFPFLFNSLIRMDNLENNIKAGILGRTSKVYRN
ncbi:hypothetical protein AN959_10560 [Psychrobacillus sp. FJAT-21963]|nr:hypothetical protein AN959_10560 [Psychrobacillus sp. FJAT-21963]